MIPKGCSSPDSNAGPRDRSKLPYRTWYQWAAGFITEYVFNLFIYLSVYVFIPWIFIHFARLTCRLSMDTPARVVRVERPASMQGRRAQSCRDRSRSAFSGASLSRAPPSRLRHPPRFKLARAVNADSAYGRPRPWLDDRRQMTLDCTSMIATELFCQQGSW